MKRTTAGRFVPHWEGEPKRRVNLALTERAWQLLAAAAEQEGLSRSELVERFARGLLVLKESGGDNRDLAECRAWLDRARSRTDQLSRINAVLLTEAIEREQELVGLKQVELLSQSLTDVFPGLLWRYSLQERPDPFNRRWCEYTGQPLDQFAGGGWIEAVHPDQAGWIAERWSHALMTGEPFEAEFAIRRASDGTYRRHLVRAAPIDEEASDWLATCVDIEDYRQQTSAACGMPLQQVLKASDLALFDWDMVSDRFNWLGSDAQLVGAPAPATSIELLKRVHPEDRPGFEAALYRACIDTHHHDHHFRILGQDGSVQKLHSTGHYYCDWDKWPVRLVGIVRAVN